MKFFIVIASCLVLISSVTLPLKKHKSRNEDKGGRKDSMGNGFAGLEERKPCEILAEKMFGQTIKYVQINNSLDQ